MDISASIQSLITSVGSIFVMLAMLALMLALFQAKITIHSSTDDEGFNATIKFTSVYKKNKGVENGAKSTKAS
jgi:hypothetical protein